MMTPSFSLTATERVLPRLALDFTTAVLDPRITFARSGNTATRINSSGYIESINADLPRFDFDPITLACKGLLIEESRANRLTYSNDFRTSWSPFNSSIDANNFVGPDNLQTAKKLVCGTATSSTSGLTKSQAATAGVTYAYTVIAKAGEHGTMRLRLGASQLVSTYFNLATGAVQSGDGIIKALGNGYYACTVTATASTTEINPFIYTYPTGTFGSYTGNGVDGLFIWNAQLEIGAFATSPILTEASAVTRNADVATMTGLTLLNQNESTYVAEFIASAVNQPAATYLLSTNVTTSGLEISLRQATNRINVGVINVVGINSAGGAITAGSVSKVAFASESGSIASYVNSNLLGTAANTYTPQALNTLYIGHQNGSGVFNGHLRKINYYPQRLINAETRAFSK